MSSQRITAVSITPVAFADPPLLNSVGVHEPFALRAVVEVSTEAGLSGLGETYADERHLAALRAAADVIVGADAYRTEQIYRRVRALAAPETTIASGLIGDSSATDRVFSPFEVACLDIQGQDSLAAMVHLAAATPNLTYACDTHWPWKTEDVVAGEPFGFSGGAIRVPNAPGLGVELDRDALARLHEQYLRCGLRNRDDTGYMRRVVPGYERRQPRW